MKDFGANRPALKVKIPHLEPATPKDLTRRAKAVDRILELRKRIGPVRASAGELIREVREEEGRG